MMASLLMLVLPVCLAVSFLCSGMEAGLFTLGRWRIMQQMRAGQARAAVWPRYLCPRVSGRWDSRSGASSGWDGSNGRIAISAVNGSTIAS